MNELEHEAKQLIRRWRDVATSGQALPPDDCSDSVLDAINQCADQLDDLIKHYERINGQ